MQMLARVNNSGSSPTVSVSTNDSSQTLLIPAKAEGHGSAVSGGDFLMLALATCCCNDLYREAQHMGMVLSSVEVEASADFDGVVLAASDIRYRARVASDASSGQVAALIRQTDAVAEIHNTVRAGVPVVLTDL